MAKMPTEETRLKRIAKNYERLPKAKRQNIMKASRSSEIVKHAQGTASGASAGRPQDRIKSK